MNSNKPSSNESWIEKYGAVISLALLASAALFTLIAAPANYDPQNDVVQREDNLDPTVEALLEITK